MLIPDPKEKDSKPRVPTPKVDRQLEPERTQKFTDVVPEIQFNPTQRTYSMEETQASGQAGNEVNV